MILLFILDPLPAACQENSGGQAALAYKVTIKGAPGSEVEEVLRSVSDAVQLLDRPPASVRLLMRRAEHDLEKFDKALEALGYFKAGVDYSIDAAGKTAELVYTIDPGPGFTILEVLVRAAGGVDGTDLPAADELGLPVGGPYTAKKVVEGEKLLLVRLGRRGHPFPKVMERNVTADYGTDSVRVEFVVDPGPRAVFGPTRIEGLRTVSGEYAGSLVPWKEGDPYDVSLKDSARKIFFNSGLFSKVEIGNPDELTNGRLPMTISVSERSHRTAKAGLAYNTDLGPGIVLGWEHRNFLGSGETFTADVSANEFKRSLDSMLKKPGFLDREQELVIRSSMADERTEAYSSSGLDVSGILRRDVFGLFSAGYGLGYRFSEVDDKDLDETETFGHAYIPLTALRDTRDKVLDPSRGYTAGFTLTPYLDTLGSGANFIKHTLNLSWYLDLIGEGRAVFAARATYGAINGAEREQVPADLRFHAGGGGTIRGYAYQTAGPLDQEDEPIGGKSMLVGGAELRFKISEHFGVTPFVDAGRAYENGHPDFDKTLFWGAGLGFQYYTAFGPVRLDAAVPLNRRGDLDEPFQLYVSLGHTF